MTTRNSILLILKHFNWKYEPVLRRGSFSTLKECHHMKLTDLDFYQWNLSKIVEHPVTEKYLTYRNRLDFMVKSGILCQGSTCTSCKSLKNMVFVMKVVIKSLVSVVLLDIHLRQ